MQTMRWAVGASSVVRVGEVDATPALDGLLPDLDPAAVERMSWLRPDFVEPSGRLRGAVQAFLIRHEGRRILVDPGIGQHKQRTAVPSWSDLDSGFLDRLAAAGTSPDDVDLVLLTHLHFDHVGWMTRMVGDRWVPTFPAARHLVDEQEFRYWTSSPVGQLPDQHAGLADSVLPVHRAGLIDLVPGDHEVVPGIRLVPTPGHTPGHVSVLVESQGQQALVTGDALHHPCQFAQPGWNAASDADPAVARSTRRELVERWADTATLLLGSHFPDPVAGRLVRADSSAPRFEPVAGATA